MKLIFLIVTFVVLHLPVAAESTLDAQAMQQRILEQMQAADRHKHDFPKDAHRKPFETFNFLGLRAGMTIMDIGAYAGYSTELLAAAVGPEGRVYSQNREQVLTNYADGYYERTMNDRLANSRLPNVVMHIREYENLELDAQLDLAFLGNIVHDFHNRDGVPKTLEFLGSIYQALKPGGILGVVDHVGIAGQDNFELHRIEPELVRNLLQRSGFIIEAESDLLANSEDSHQVQVYSDTIYRRTDRFVIRARKPK